MDSEFPVDAGFLFDKAPVKAPIFRDTTKRTPWFKVYFRLAVLGEKIDCF
jgi:hypothetical protein